MPRDELEDGGVQEDCNPGNLILSRERKTNQETGSRDEMPTSH